MGVELALEGVFRGVARRGEKASLVGGARLVRGVVGTKKEICSTRRIQNGFELVFGEGLQ